MKNIKTKTSLSLSDVALRQLADLCDFRTKSQAIELLLDRAWRRRQRKLQNKQSTTPAEQLYQDEPEYNGETQDDSQVL